MASRYDRAVRAIRAAIARVRLRRGAQEHSPEIQAELEAEVAKAIERVRREERGRD